MSTTLDTFTYGAVSGEVTHGDKLRFIMHEDNCDEVLNVFSFYTYEKPGDIYQLKDRIVPIKINGDSLTAKVFLIKPFLMGYQVWFSLGEYPIKQFTYALNEFYQVHKKYEIEIGIPSAAALIMKEAGIQKGSGTSGTDWVGDVTIDSIIKVANTKLEKSYATSLKSVAKTIIGTCVALGVKIEGKTPKEMTAEINEGKWDEKLK